MIVDQGGPVQPEAAVPTMTKWGMIAMILLLAAGSIHRFLTPGVDWNPDKH